MKTQFMTVHFSRVATFLLLLAVTTIACLPGCSSFQPTGKVDKEIRLLHLGTEINSPADDYAPLLVNSGRTLFFTSNREVGRESDTRDKLFVSERTDTRWQDASRVQTSLKREGSEGAVSVDQRNNHVYFGQCYQPDGIGDCDLYVADLEGSQWTRVRNAGNTLNSNEWDAHPSITADGNTLFFASERYGGKGGSDIWVATLKNDGTWTVPVNLGEPINTSSDEKTPFISADGTMLTFASDGHRSMGGYDLFESKRNGKGWSIPRNLGVPYNSPDDDVFFTASASGDTACISSNREGSRGGFDIYEIVRIAPPPPPPPPPKRQPLIVRYTLRNAFTLEPVAGTVTLATDGMDEYVQQAEADGVISAEIIPGREYTATAVKSRFMSGIETFYYTSDESGQKDRQLLLTPVFENERKIYGFVVEFDFNYFNIRPEEKKNLDSVVSLLARYPNSTVVVSGHTDSVGTDAYNIKLGYNRAKEVSTYVERYLHEQGAKLRNKLEVRTYGETEPIATNSTEEGRQRNRRVEIAIIRNE